MMRLEAADGNFIARIFSKHLPKVGVQAQSQIVQPSLCFGLGICSAALSPLFNSQGEITYISLFSWAR